MTSTLTQYTKNNTNKIILRSVIMCMCVYVLQIMESEIQQKLF